MKGQPEQHRPCRQQSEVKAYAVRSMLQLPRLRGVTPRAGTFFIIQLWVLRLRKCRKGGSRAVQSPGRRTAGLSILNFFCCVAAWPDGKEVQCCGTSVSGTVTMSQRSCRLTLNKLEERMRPEASLAPGLANSFKCSCSKCHTVTSISCHAHPHGRPHVI